MLLCTTGLGGLPRVSWPSVLLSASLLISLIACSTTGQPRKSRPKELRSSATIFERLRESRIGGRVSTLPSLMLDLKMLGSGAGRQAEGGPKYMVLYQSIDGKETA